MKNIFRSIVAVAILAGFASCEDEADLQYLKSDADFSILSPQSGEGVVLSVDTPTNPALALTWQDMDYGTPTEVTYTVEAVKNGDTFDDPIEISSTTNTYLTVDTQTLNATALAAGLAANTQGALDIRIRASVGAGAEIKYSNVITYLVTPYPSNVKRQLYLVGAATSAGWDNNHNNFAIFRAPDDDNMYTYTGYFNSDGGAGGQFKLLETLGQWQPQWGTNGGDDLAVNDGTGSDPGTFQIPAAGYYTFTANLNTMKFTLTPYDASTAPTYTTVGIIGSATANGWDASTAMTQDPNDPHKWYILNIALTTNEAKFRANDAWDVNWGASTPISGVGTQGGPNIPVEAGTYNVYFNDLDGRYLLVPVQ